MPLRAWRNHNEDAPLTLTATTTGAAETVTIQQLTLRVDTVVNWGDGSSTELPADSVGAITHDYAAAGTYNIVIPRARHITAIDIRTAKIGSLDTAQLSGCAMTYFYIAAITGSTIRSADMVAWRPTDWILYSLPAGTYAIDSADMVNWRPTVWYLSSMPAAGTYDIDSADMVDWRPTHWHLAPMPAGTYAIDSADMVAWRPTTWFLASMPAGTYAIDSADMVDWRPTNWYLYSMPAGTYAIDSADTVAWRPVIWLLYSMPAGTYDIDSADMVDWRPTTWQLYSMPAGTYDIDSADMVDWRPTTWQLSSMPAAGSSYTFAAACMLNWAAATSILANNLGLLTAVVDVILTDIYAGFATRTGAGGTINVGGTNQAPTGVYQAACPPVPGKEIAFELTNDTCAIAANHWTTVTFTA